MSGLCENCVSGGVIEGEPKGFMEKIGPWDTYVSKPKHPKNESSGVVYFCDVFGLKLKNNKINADILAEKTGITVYVPDTFEGDALPENSLKIPDTADEDRQARSGLFNKVSRVFKLLPIIPWFMRHKPSQHENAAIEFMDSLKKDKNITKLGATGYCYGAPFTIKFNETGVTDCSVVSHPSMVNETSFNNIKTPISFVCAESDEAFPDTLKNQVKEYLEKNKPEIETEFVTYKGTTHGFVARPNLSIDHIKDSHSKAMDQAAAFLSKHLL